MSALQRGASIIPPDRKTVLAHIDMSAGDRESLQGVDQLAFVLIPA
jgi:hypothetical protein